MHLKRLLLVIFVSFCGFGLANAQSTTDYGSRTTAVNNEEKKIEAYITQNLSKTPSSAISDFKKSLVSDVDHPTTYTSTEINQKVDQFKRGYWRIQYFISNPEAMKAYRASESSDCSNGDFESGTFNNFNLWDAGGPGGSNGYHGGECSFLPTTMIPAAPNPNLFTITNVGNDPIVGIPMVHSGQHAARINSDNPCTAQFGVNKLTRTFNLTADRNEITFSYALVMQNPSGHGTRQPVFVARVLDASGNELDRVCHFADATDPFFSSQVINHCYNTLTVWADWTCDELEIGGKAGESYTLEIWATDCGAGAHWGYAYVDDICEPCQADPCNDQGSIDLNPTDSCWDVGGQFQLCGTYELPVIKCVSGTLDYITLEVFQNGTYTPVNVVPTINTTNHTFCFTLDSGDFPNTNAGFDFKVTAHFLINGGTHIEIDYHSNPGLGNDIVFSCVPVEPCLFDGIKGGDRPLIPVNPDKPTFVDFTTVFGGGNIIGGGNVIGGGSFVQVEPVDRTITSDEIWHDKVYIPNNVIITVKGAILDLTNVDVIFGECAGIVFEEGAIMRANNSVFRPCDMNKTWLGFTYIGSANGVLNECTFKNAQIAMNYIRVPEAKIKTVNNLFENCRISIQFSESRNFDGITGNTFYVDRNAINYHVECKIAIDAVSILPYHSDHYGVLAHNSVLYGNVSQNDFINAQEVEGTDTTKLFYGVQLNECSYGEFSSNNFTDLYRSVEVNRSSNVHIEANRLEVNSFNYYGVLKSQHQINVNSSSSVNVSNNTLIYSFTKEREDIPWNTHSAIYLENASQTTVNNNQIKGFESAVQAVRCSDILIKENTLEDVGYVGIYLDNVLYSDVMCNTLNLEDDNKTTRIGIYYVTQDKSSPEVNISGNCIFEASTAMLFDGLGDYCFILPRISNNFMYNYTEFGIDIRYMTGDIGQSGGAQDGGRNTFASNHTSAGSVDVRVMGACPVGVDGNYGVISVDGPISLGGNEFYSTASCGAQLPENSHKLAEVYDETCDAEYFRNEKPFGGTPYGKFEISENASEMLNGMQIDDQVTGWFNLCVQNKDNLLQEFYNLIKSSKAVYNATWLDYQYYVHSGDYQKCVTLIDGITTDSYVTSHRILLERAKLGYLIDGNTSNLVRDLENIVSSNCERAVFYEAREIIQSVAKGNEYIFVTMKQYQPMPAQNIKLLDRNKMVLYPNPVDNELTIDYYLDSESEVMIRVVDLLGRTVLTKTISSQSDIIRIDVSTLKDGAYILELSGSDDTKQVAKFMKQ
ncbi:MAG: T9SS type A sorting domain-containing protein [Flavobacteriales bacterium]|nr:T9SS type A sorting domain-containing protein [Flavobacteriales bacterium]